MRAGGALCGRGAAANPWAPRRCTTCRLPVHPRRGAPALCAPPPRPSLASCELRPLRSCDGGASSGAAAAGALDPSLAGLAGPGVFAIYSADGSLQYIGLTRRLEHSLADLAAAFPPAEAAGCRAEALPGAGDGELKAAWLAWVQEHGAAPPGNARGADPRWAKPPRARAAGAAAGGAALPLSSRLQQQMQQQTQRSNPEPFAPPDTDADRWAAPHVDALLAAHDAAARLAASAEGYVIIDGALDAATVAAAARAAAALDAAGALRPVASQAGGRSDRCAVAALPAPGAAALAAGRSGAPLPAPAGAPGAPAAADAAALARVAAFLMAVPAALNRSEHFSAVRGRALAPPQSLQLAVYDSDGAFYRCHVDNPGADAPGARDGPPGLRTGDRAVTAILYLNPSWEPAHGGRLRVWGAAGAGAVAADGGAAGASATGAGGGAAGNSCVDVEPLGGRLLLFRSADVEHEVLSSQAPRWALSAWVPWLESCAQ